MRRALIVSGALLMTYAVIGAATDAQVNPFGVLVFGLAVLVLHDAVFLPLVLLAGEMIRRRVPQRWRATVRVAAIVDLAVVVVALPLVLGPGHTPGDPTMLPHPYAMGLLLIVVVTTVTVAACRKGIERSRTGRRRRPHG